MLKIIPFILIVLFLGGCALSKEERVAQYQQKADGFVNTCRAFGFVGEDKSLHQCVFSLMREDRANAREDLIRDSERAQDNLERSLDRLRDAANNYNRRGVGNNCSYTAGGYSNCY